MRRPKGLARAVSASLLVAGTVVGVGAVASWALGWMPPVPPWMVRVAMVKLALLGAGGLLSAGALVGRWALSSKSPESAANPDQQPQLPPSPMPDLGVRARDKSPVPQDRP